MLAALLFALSTSVAHAQDGPSRADAEAALEAAYQKEIAYLVAEKRALQGRLHELEATHSKADIDGDASIAGLQGRVLGLERRADEVESRLDDLSDATIVASERKALLESTVQQGRDALAIELADGATEAEQLQTVFSASRDGLSKSSTIQSSTGKFFLPDGSQVEGNIVQVGQIAAYGQSGTEAGPLLPLGEGRLMLRASSEGSDTARAVIAGQQPASMGLFLLESFEKPVSERTERTALETVQAGGLVAWVIVGIGILALILSALRAMLLARASRGNQVIYSVDEALRNRQTSAAKALIANDQTPTARVLGAILDAPVDHESDPREALQDVAAAAILDESPSIERFGALILVIAAVAPLLGLLGTVTGMIATFEIITEFGTGDPAMLSGGIGEALITTQLGLVVAIPAVLLGNVLKGRQNEVLRMLEHAALTAINLRCDQQRPDDDQKLAAVATDAA
jgi:biopolymer transport protein ExbB